MNPILKNVNMITNISKYLPFNQTIIISKLNKQMYFSILNPIKNPRLNSLYRKYTFKKVYLNAQSPEEQKKEEIYDDYSLTKNNWKIIYKNLIMNYKTYQNKNITELVFNCFRNHLFLPSMRKSNKYLDFKYNTIHQLISYDILFYNNVICNHYNKYINENGFIQQSNNDFILKKGLFFENELINFNTNLNFIQKNNYLKGILKKIINYDYENLNDIYLNNNKDNNLYNNNEVIKFMLWLNYTVFYFAKFVYSYINIYSISNNDNNKNKFLSEFISKHNDFINFSLLINDHFNNINIIINYLNKFILLKNDPKNNNINNNNIYYFSIYKMCINIMKKEIYDKLNNELKKKFEYITNIYIDEIFEKKENEINQNDSKTKEDSNSFEEYEENYDNEIDDSLLNEDKEDEMSNKELFENYILCISDYNINEYNANLINHSELKMNDEYLNYEEIIFNIFIKKINKYIEQKSFNEIFNIIQKVFSMQNDDINNLGKDNEISLNVIKRTKKYIFCRLMNYLKTFFENKIKEDLLNEKNNINNISIKNNLVSNIENKLNEKQKIIFLNLYYNEINNIKNNLKIKGEEKKINDYFENNDNYYFIVLKNILYCYYLEIEYYSKMDNKIIDILLNYNKKYESFISESIANN